MIGISRSELPARGRSAPEVRQGSASPKGTQLPAVCSTGATEVKCGLRDS